MQFMRLVKVGLIVISSLISTSVLSSVLKINGFASAYGGINLDDEVTTYGYDDSVRYKSDTLFGVQFTSQLNDKVSAVVQLVGEAKDNFDINANWAYISYNVDENWTVQAGRIRIPWYMMSNYLDAKQSYHWARAPQGVYSAPFNAFEGFKVRHRAELGEWNSEAAFTAGDYSNPDYVLSGSTLPPTTFEAKDWLSVSWDLTTETQRVFMSIHSNKMSLEPENIAQALAELGEEYPDVAKDIQVKEKQMYIYALGYSFDNAEYMVQAEWTLFDLDGYFSDQYSSYVSVGKYFDNLLVHFTYEIDENKPHNSLANGIPKDDDLHALALSLLSAQKKDNDVYSVGIKYDLNSNTSFKTQLSIDETNGKTGKVLAAGIDYIF